MFRAVCRSSSGAPTVFAASGLHTAGIQDKKYIQNLIHHDFEGKRLFARSRLRWKGDIKSNIMYDSVAITNKMQLGTGIYYSTVH